jgi:hypothetical protein
MAHATSFDQFMIIVGVALVAVLLVPLVLHFAQRGEQRHRPAT